MGSGGRPPGANQGVEHALVIATSTNSGGEEILSGSDHMARLTLPQVPSEEAAPFWLKRKIVMHHTHR